MSKISEYRTEVKYECDACRRQVVSVASNLNVPAQPEVPPGWTQVTVLKNIDGRLSQDTNHYCEQHSPVIDV